MYLPWILFGALLLTVFVLDLFVFNRKAQVIPLKKALFTVFFWIAVALAFNVYVYYARGSEAAVNFLTGYLVEKSLSIDNIFVFMLIFKYFHTPESSRYRVLFLGIIGAILMRGLFIWLGLALIEKFDWLIYLLGAFLVFTGIKFLINKEKKIAPEKNPFLKWLRRILPVTENYEKNQFFVLKKSKYFVTPLFIVLIVIESTDIIFALDSIPAIFSITTDPFIVYTSNIFALLGVKSLYFVFSRFMEMFRFLHLGLGAILIFIGCKMVSSHYFRINNLVALGVVLVILGAVAVFSFKRKTRN